MWKYFALGFLVFVAVLSVLIIRQPSQYSVSRSALINAPANAVFAEVNDFHRWVHWSPWAKLDPNAVNEYSGADAGEGAVMAWDGNHEVGKGSMTIVESTAPSMIRLRLDFLKPMKSTSDTIFQFQEQPDGTLITWTMSGDNNFIGKAMNLIIDCDKMIGGYFEQGLSNLKSLVEV